MITDSVVLMYIVGLLMGMAAGYVMHRSDYCFTGMFRDAILFKDFFMLRALVVQIAATMIFFELLRRANLLPLYPFPLLGSASFGSVIGGAFFGVGMVLAGGCVVGTLYKMGAGSLVSATAFVGLIGGSGLYAELHPWWSTFAKRSVIVKQPLTVPALLHIDPGLLVLAVTLPLLLLFYRWKKRGFLTVETAVRGYLQPWKTGIVLAVIGAVSYVAVGMPLGITTTYAKFAALIEKVFIPAHVADNVYFAALPLNVVHPSSEALLQGGAGPALDAIWRIQFPVIAGIVLGSFLSALLLGEYRWHARVPGRQLVMAFCGGILLALGSRMTPGCNVWHLMGGVPILAMQSLLFVVGLLPGTWLGCKILTRVVMSSSRG